MALLLSGCKEFAILNPKGVIAVAEKHLLLDATYLMLIVVIPVIILSFIFAYRYRSKNKQAKYTPNWSHSYVIEATCWAIPLIIIGVLAAMTWISTHKLDPYRPLNSKLKPIKIQAIALDWRWLFIYPKQHIATINFVQIPVNVPVRFYVTADAPMNSIEIPQLAGQIYAMTGMQTKLNLMASEKGVYNGMSTNFSGDGFSWMRFKVKAGSPRQFNAWVAKMKRASKHLTWPVYVKLAKPSKDETVVNYSHTEKNLFAKIIDKYMMPSKSHQLINKEKTKKVGKKHA